MVGSQECNHCISGRGLLVVEAAEKKTNKAKLPQAKGGKPQRKCKQATVSLSSSSSESEDKSAIEISIIGDCMEVEL